MTELEKKSIAIIETVAQYFRSEIDETVANSVIRANMTDFAKLHVKAALTQAAEKVTWILDPDPGEEYEVSIDRASILTAYPENLIK
jgi:hypothetical protein